MKAITCPHCEKEFGVSAKSVIPPEQRMSVRLTLEEGMSGISAKTLGEHISATESLLRNVAKDMGSKISVFVEDVRFEAKTIEMDYFLTEVKLASDQPADPEQD